MNFYAKFFELLYKAYQVQIL